MKITRKKKQQCSEIEKKLKESKKVNMQMDQENQNLRLKNDSLSQEFHSNREKCEQILNELTFFKHEQTRLLSESENNHKKFNEILAQKEQLGNELTAVKCQLNDKMNCISQQTEAIKSEKEKLLNLNQESSSTISSLNEVITHNRQEMSDKTKTIEKLESKMNDLLKRFEIQEKEIAVAENDKKQLNNDIIIKMDEIDKLQQHLKGELNDKMTLKTSHENEKNYYEQLIVDLETENKVSKENKKMLEEEIEQLNSNLTSICAQLDDNKKATMQMDQEIQNFLA